MSTLSEWWNRITGAERPASLVVSSDLPAPVHPHQQAMDQGWQLYRCRLTGTVVRGLQAGSGGVFEAEGQPKVVFAAGDYFLKPFGGSGRVYAPKAEFEERFEPLRAREASG